MEGFEFLAIPEKFSSLDVVSYQYFNQLLNNRTIVFNNEVAEDIIESVILPLKDYERDDDDSPVTLILNTDGGEVVNAITLLDVIDNYKKKLNIICLHAFSMGANIMCAGRNNPNVTKYCYQHSYILFHNGQSTVSAETRTAEDFINFYKSLNERLDNYVITNTNIPKEEYDTFDRKQIFLDSKQMLLYGIVDEIIGVAKLPSTCKDCVFCHDCDLAYEIALNNSEEEKEFFCEEKQTEF